MGKLILSRRKGQVIVIGTDDAEPIEIQVHAIRKGLVDIAILAPNETAVHRSEIYTQINPGWTQRLEAREPVEPNVRYLRRRKSTKPET